MSEILQGVLRMPPVLWSGSELDIAQRHQRYVEAAEHIEKLESQLAESEVERHEQARLLGMSAERELSLRAQFAETQRLLRCVKRDISGEPYIEHYENSAWFKAKENALLGEETE